MALVVADRVKETTATTGTGTYTLAGAEIGFQSFLDGVGNGNTTYYVVTNDIDWEVGIGTFTASGTTLSRDSILASSNADAAVNWGAGTKSVFVTYPAGKAATIDRPETLTNKTINGSNNTITNVSLTTGVTGTLPIGNGGTNATTAADARTNLAAAGTGDANTFTALNTFSGGANITPAATPATNAVGYLGAPQIADQDDYTLVMADAGKHYYHVSASPHTLTIPANASVAFPIGTVIGVVNANGAGDLTIAITSDTLVYGTATGSQVLPEGTETSLIKVAATTWRLSGANITPVNPTESFIVACSDETTALTTGTAKVTFRMPYAFTLSAVRASVTTAPTGSVLTVDINEGGVSILSTKLTIDVSEKTSTTAATPAVISDSSLADDAEITIDIDTVGSTVAGAGLKVVLIGNRT
jgi:hypothetical protein